MTTPTAEELLARFTKLVAEDKLDNVLAKARKPKGVSAGRWGIAVRMKGELLNASAHSVRSGLSYNRDSQRKTPTLAPVRVVIVKARASKVARLGTKGWSERYWRISPVRHGPGFLILSDEGTESKVFPSVDDALAAIRASGWEIVKSMAARQRTTSRRRQG